MFLCYGALTVRKDGVIDPRIRSSRGRKGVTYMRQPSVPVVRRIVGGTIALALGLALVVLGMGAAPAVHAGSGGGATKYVLKYVEHTVLAAFQVVADDNCTVTEVSITGGEDVSRELPMPSTQFGPAAFAVVTHYNQCTDETLFAGAGITEDVSLAVANSLSSASLTATIPVSSFDAPPDSPPAFYVTVPNLIFTATGPAVHSVQTRHFNMQGANLVEHLNAASAPATTDGTVTIGYYGSVSAPNLLIAEIDDYQAGTTRVSNG